MIRFPEVGSSSFKINLISVDFPLPDEPTKKANSPLSITKFAFFTAFVPVPIYLTYVSKFYHFLSSPYLIFWALYSYSI